MKKAFDQTLRDIKREVNKKVLKVPSIEQKVLDATSNEPWGPHGSLLADIAMASRNYHEYQMIMAVIWKRLSDTGKNWRHVYKGLTVLEYLVAHGSERVLDEIREHGYQISALSEFQYIDSSGRDQGNNVRRKSHNLVLLVNDKERIEEVRQKATTNRDKYRSTTAVGGMYKPGSGGYGDDHYGSREDERNGYGRDREWGYRDDEKNGRYRDSYSREGDCYGRDSEDHYGRQYRDDGFRGTTPSVDGNRRSSEGNGGCAYDDDDRHSSRGSSIKPENHSQDGRPMERKFSEQSFGTPLSYEEAVGDSRSLAYSERGGETTAAAAPQSSPDASATTAPQLSPPNANVAPQSSSPIANAALPSSAPDISQTVEADAFKEFDPRAPVSAAPSITNNAEMDLFGSLSDVFSANPLAIMPAPPVNGNVEADSVKAASNVSFGATASQNNVLNPSFEDAFGDSPFKAIPSDDAPTQIQNVASMPSSFPPHVNSVEQTEPAFQKLDTTVSNEFTNAFPGVNFDPLNVPNAQTGPSPQYPTQEALAYDILAGILPPAGRLLTSQASFPSSDLPPMVPEMPVSAPNGLPQATSAQHFAAEPTMASFPQPVPQSMAETSTQLSYQKSLPYTYQSTGLNSNGVIQAQTGSLTRQSSDFSSDLLPQTGSTVSSQYAPNSAGPLALVPQPASKDKEKFELKSAVWADTLSKGLVDLNISGPKCNPLADIGVDFESLNRKEKRMEKPSTAQTASTVSMGKAMGSGSGVGRANAGAMRPSPNPTMGLGGGPGMGMGMGGGPSVGMGMGGAPGTGMRMGGGRGMGMGIGGYGPMSQPRMGMGMGMNGMGMGQGMQMQQSNGFGPSNMNYNPMMGRGGYLQQPYYGSYQ